MGLNKKTFLSLFNSRKKWEKFILEKEQDYNIELSDFFKREILKRDYYLTNCIWELKKLKKSYDRIHTYHNICCYFLWVAASCFLNIKIIKYIVSLNIDWLKDIVPILFMLIWIITFGIFYESFNYSRIKEPLLLLRSKIQGYKEVLWRSEWDVEGKGRYTGEYTI